MSGVFHPSFREIQRVWQRTREEVGAAREREGREGGMDEGGERKGEEREGGEREIEGRKKKGQGGN